MSVIGLRIHLRLFLEGVEIPVVSANVQAQKNAPAVCSIQIPANDYAMDILPRTRVWLFNYDVYNGAPPAEQVSLGGPGVRVEATESRLDPEINGLYPPERFASTEDQSLADLENANYKHMFSGEVVGVNYMKTPTSRCVVLQCVDWSNYWDIAYQYQLSGFELGGGGIKAAFTGAGTTVFNDFLEGSGDIVARLINTPPRSYPNLGGTLLGAITHIIEAIGGVYYGKRSIRGTNDFFSLAEMSLHITQMLGVNPYSSKDESRLLAANGFGSLFTRALSGLGKLVTIRQVLMALQKYIFHEIIPITSPRYIPALYDPNLPQVELVGISDDPVTAPLSGVAKTLKARAEELIERQKAAVDVESATVASNRRGGLTAELKKLQRLAHDASVRAASSPATAEIAAAFVSAGGELVQVGVYTRALSGTGNRFHWGDASGPTNRVILHCTAVVSYMTAVLESKHKKKIARTVRQPDPPVRLITQIYRPDVWMVAPPRCNVWFPELYSSFNYGRQFQNEVTRLLLRTHSAFYGSDQIFDGYYIAPGNPKGVRSGKNIGRGRAAPNVTTARDTTGPANIDMPAWVLRDLMDHELYTGIIPSFERMSDLNLHAIRGGQVEVNGVKVDYAQLAANHIFFQYRFRSRDLSLSGKFNPYAVLGFPSLVIDKYKPLDLFRELDDYDSALANKLRDAINDGESPGAGMPEDEQRLIVEANTARTEEAIRSITSQRPNTHFLGTPAVLSHNVDASRGGTTTVQMEYARTTNERAEFLSDNTGTTPRVKRKKNVPFTSEVAALYPPVVGSTGPRGGEITKVIDVTDKFTRAHAKLKSTNRTATGRNRYKGGTLLPLFVPDRRAQGRVRRGTRVLVGVEQPASSYDPEVVALVGSGGTVDASTQNVLVSFKAYSVRESIGVYVREQVELSPEDYTFPPWYGESYRSNRIGALYAYFFGTGSITDPITVADAAAVPRGSIPGLDTESSNVLLNRELAAAVLSATGGSSPQPGFSDVPQVADGDLLGGPIDPLSPEAALHQAVMGQVEFRSDLGEAVEEIVNIYSKVKQQGFDVHEFLRAYTWRPIASVVELLGTSNLQISDEGEVLVGTEGFHSRAFGDFDDLRQLVGPGDGTTRPQTILGQTTVETASGFEKAGVISARMDTRKEKRTVVLSYLYSVLASRGILG